MSETRPFPIVNDWAKGCYLAKVTGSHPKYVYDREFIPGDPVKTRRTLEYSPGSTLPADLEAAWYVMRDRTGQTDLLEVGPVGWRVVASYVTAGEVLDVFELGAPGADGAWDGARCSNCDVPIRTPDDGANSCGDCSKVKADRASAPDQVPF